MAKTPLMQSIVRAWRIASLSNRRNSPPAGELIGMVEAASESRRRFLKGSLAGAAGVALGGGLAFPERVLAQKDAGPKIVIVGGGVAGLHAAHLLKKAGVRSNVFEAAGRTGGRMFTAKDVMGAGLTTELGGEFVDTKHETMHALAKEFNLELIDVHEAGEASLKRETYFFGGSHRTAADLVEAFKPLAEKIEADKKDFPETIDAENKGGGADAIDKLSIKGYLDKIGATGWVRDLLVVAFVTEFGGEADEQSALNMLTMLSTDVSEGEVALLGESDERYKVKGGNQRVVDELAKSVETLIHRNHRLEAIQSAGSGYKLNFQAPGGGSAEVTADILILALPFSLLREVTIRVDLPAIKKQAIKELGYGNNAKVMAGVQKRIWRDQGYAGNIYSDEAFQLGWDNSRLQPGEAGGVTFYSGGKPGIEVGKGTPEEQAKRLMTGFDRAFNGVAAIQTGKYERFHWPTHPWSKGSYACYKPGQWTTIAGVEGKAVGKMFFAGEHTSQDFQGFMEGGAATGKAAAEAVLELVKK